MGDPGLTPGVGRSPEGNGNPLQSSCLGNLMDRVAWQAIVHEIVKDLVTKQYWQQRPEQTNNNQGLHGSKIHFKDSK